VLDAFIDSELRRAELPPSACALVGFSQGTMMALHGGLRRAEPLAALVGLSGMLPDAGGVTARPPTVLIHGDQDEVIPVQALFASLDGLAAAGVPAMWRICGGAGHTVAEDGLALATDFLRAAFAGRFAGWTGPQRRG
jgi:phospholipase/carboxylesterase